MFTDHFVFKNQKNLPNRQKTSGWLKKSICLITFFMAVLISSHVTAASVTLAWDPNDPGPDGYMLFIRLAGSNYNYNAPALIAATSSCRVEGLVPGTTYYMVVRAYVGSAQSGDSNEIYYTPPVPAGMMGAAAMSDYESFQQSQDKPPVARIDTDTGSNIPAVANLKLTSKN